MQISFIIPTFNEEATLSQLFERIADVMEAAEVTDFEVLFIDDGSRDNSWDVIQQLHDSEPKRVRAIKLRRNVGKATALSVGFKQAKGEILFTMDADLQDDPAEIPNFLKKLDEGYDLVSGWKQNRDDPLDKTLPSKLFNFVTRAFSGMKLHDFNCGFKAYRREAVEFLDLYGELHRFIPLLVNAEGYRVSEIPVVHHARVHGQSKYGWTRLYKGFLDLLTVVAFTRYSQRPAHLFGGVGIVVGAIGLLILGYLSFMKIFWGMGIGSRPLFFLGILNLLLSAQLVSLGVIGELIFRNGQHLSPEHYINKTLE